MSYRGDKQGQTQRDLLREKAAIGILSAHLGRDARHVERPYAPVDGILYGGVWAFVEHKSRPTPYRPDWWIPVRKVVNLMTLCVEYEALPMLSVWYLDAPMPGEFFFREVGLDDLDRFGVANMRPRHNSREGISEDQSTEPALAYPVYDADIFTRVF